MVLTIQIDRNTTTVAEMRRRLAKMLSKLSGDQPVSFEFHAVMDNIKLCKSTKCGGTK